MDRPSFRFDRFLLDPADRQLRRDGAAVELNARYLDALALLVGDAGKLVTKDRFMDEVWRGVPVTDEALTQCIKMLRRQLGDDAARPRFIETVPKHGYRFIAPVETVEGAPPATAPAAPEDGAAAPPAAAPMATAPLQNSLLLGFAGTVGAGFAGAAGGLLYGFAGAAPPLGPGMGAASILLVLTCLTILAAVIGGAGVSFGIAAARFASGPGRAWIILGGAAGGLIVGAFGKLLGLDAFNLLFGRTPGNITGAGEGAVLGAAVGLGVWFASRRGAAWSLGRAVAAAAAIGGLAGILIPLLGGRMMGGSLDLLARAFPDSRLRLDRIGGMFGESGLGPVSQVATGAVEGMLFGGCIVGAMLLTRRGLER